MTQAELLDALARAIDAPRHDGRLTGALDEFEIWKGGEK